MKWEGRSMLGKNTIGKAMEGEDLVAFHHLGKPQGHALSGSPIGFLE
jgi:hypothetical protein